jgi:hypothetical protein
MELGTTIHMCISVRGMLRWDRRELKKATKWITPTAGGRYTVEQLREALLDELAQGHEVLPYGECEGFDFKKGCPGHRKPPAPAPEDK